LAKVNHGAPDGRRVVRASVTSAYSWAMPTATTWERPCAAAARINGRITSTLRWPLPNRTTGMWLACV